MLQSLELTGFKSFADKTRFEFSAGITAIVGPNGSGKSNIVDAVKWVLGAQSVKSLRGKEMADVIFAGTGGRSAINTAEVTLKLDNRDGSIPQRDGEVLISRRIYRNGESEYLIDKEPCRLRDIRELLAGTGIATDAYSIIEQGKVDVMLQSSPRERRALFEEAAGISRFKAKKAETTRRLERADQNLTRLADIAEEVETRLKRLRNQAVRARRYEELTHRLKMLRVKAAADQYVSLNERLLGCEHRVNELGATRQSSAERLSTAQQRARSLQEQLQTAENKLQTTERESSGVRELVARLQTTFEQQSIRAKELGQELSHLRGQLGQQQWQCTQLRARRNEEGRSLQKACDREKDAGNQAAQSSKVLEEVDQSLAQQEAEHQAAREERETLSRKLVTLDGHLSVLRSQLASAQAAEQKCQTDLAALIEEKDAQTTQAAESQSAQDALAQQVSQFGERLRATRQAAAEDRRQLAAAQEELSDLRVRRTGAAQRAAVLEELQKRLEGVAAGTKYVLGNTLTDADRTAAGVRGLVADLLHVELEMAPIIELVLGPRAHFIVVDTAANLNKLVRRFETALPGRAGLVTVEQPHAANVADTDLTGHEGVLGRLDQFVDADPENIPLVRRLLGTTWLVEDLPTAIELTSSGRAAAAVTQNGEFVAENGDVLLGPKDSEAGVLSRQSELESLQDQLQNLDRALEELAGKTLRMEETIAQQEELTQSLSPEHAALTGKLSEQRLRTAAARDALEQTNRTLDVRKTEHTAAARQVEEVGDELEKAKAEYGSIQQNLASLEKKVESLDAECAQSRQNRIQYEQALGDARVALATAQQEVRSAKVQCETTKHRLEAVELAAQQGSGRIEVIADKLTSVERTWLQASSEYAHAMLRRESLLRQIDAIGQDVHARRQQVARANEDKEKQQQAHAQVESELQQQQLVARQLQHERKLLVDRYRDEFEVDLEKLDPSEVDAASSETANAEEEIAALRRKVANLGAVNLEAIEELSDLEQRHELLSSQHQDLSSAKASLEQVIQRINTDSRKMFLATIDVVRKHFQDLFQRLFGGGQADIVLEGEEDEDVLEQGIEILARPPGKEPRSISLLSGGEKTLTCVALLLAVFRSRPSPFCILDEVDAALDEANIERFTAVLREFLQSTQFIIVTHSKRTMTCADTLYGITMQETGISKPVAVQFDDRSQAAQNVESKSQPDKKHVATDDSQAA